MRGLALLACVGVCASASLAGTITFTNNNQDRNGTGFGNVLTVLSLQTNGTEHGSIFRDATNAADVKGDAATNASATHSVTEMTTENISPDHFFVVFNINQQGNDLSLTLRDFSLRFYTSTANNTSFFDVNYTAPLAGLVLPIIDNGNGKAGWLFEVQLSPAETAAFTGNGDHRMGMYVSSANAIGVSNDGADSFFIQGVPEPTSLAALGAGSLALLRRRRR